MAGFENDIVYALNGDFTQADNQAPSESNGLVTNGQLWIGSTALNAGSTHINVGTLTSPGSSITIGYSSPNITLTAGAAIATTYTANSGSATPALNNLNIFGATVAAGTTPVATSASGSTVTVNVQRSQAVASTGATTVGLANFDSAAFDVDANGFVQLNGGGIAVTALGVQGASPPGTNPVLPTAAGQINFRGLIVAAGTDPIIAASTLANTVEYQVQLTQAIAAADNTRVGLANFDSARFTVSNGFVSASGTGLGQTITGDSGGALSPTAGNWNILGGPGVTTSGSGSTLTINSVVYTNQGVSTTVTSDSGSFATAAITLTLPAAPAQGELLEFVCTTASALVVDAPSTHLIRIGTLVTSAGGTATSTAIGDSLTLRFRAADTTWYATSVIGVWLIA